MTVGWGALVRGSGSFLLRKVMPELRPKGDTEPVVTEVRFQQRPRRERELERR